MARLLRLLPDPTRAHEPGSVDPPKITLVSLAAVAERAQSLQRTAPSWRAKVPCSGRRRFTDGVLAHVRTPGGPTSPAQPLFRLTRSPPIPIDAPKRPEAAARPVLSPGDRLYSPSLMWPEAVVNPGDLVLSATGT